MQQTMSGTDVADMLFAINGVVDARVRTPQRLGASGPGKLPDEDVAPGSEWRRSLLDSSLNTAALVDMDHPDGGVIRVECHGFVAIAQQWDRCTIAVMAKMGTPATKSLARAIRRVRGKVEPATN